MADDMAIWRMVPRPERGGLKPIPNGSHVSNLGSIPAIIMILYASSYSIFFSHFCFRGCGRSLCSIRVASGVDACDCCGWGEGGGWASGG